jgi:two-component system response regulator YesN
MGNANGHCMYKLLIVDDEFYIREGIRRLINWNSLGITIVGVCENGQEGYDLAVENKPDIIIMDINMSSLSGIEMAEKIKKEFDCQFIIISGYKEFEYARSAMLLGINSYLVKPIRRDALEDAVLRAIGLIEKEKKTTSKKTLLESEYIVDFLMNVADVGDAREILRMDNYRVMILKSEKPFAVGTTDKEEIYNKVSELLGTQYFYFIGDSSFLTIVPAVYNEYEKINNLFGCKVKIGISNPSYGELSVFKTVYTQAEIALQQLLSQNSIDTVLEYSEKFNKRLNGYYYDSMRHIINAVECGDDKQAIVEIEKVFNQARNDNIMLSDFIQWALSLYGVLYNLYKQNFPDSVEEERHNKLILENSKSDFNINQIKEQLIELCVSNETEDINVDIKSNSVVEDVRQYIDENFCKDISLQKIAGIFYIEFRYLSKLFKAHTGMRYVQYLTHKRLEYAKKLLANSNLTIYEIAEVVSFEDVKYFSNLFKKYEGISPREYRVQHKI